MLMQRIRENEIRAMERAAQEKAAKAASGAGNGGGGGEQGGPAGPTGSAPGTESAAQRSEPASRTAAEDFARRGADRERSVQDRLPERERSPEPRPADRVGETRLAGDGRERQDRDGPERPEARVARLGPASGTEARLEPSLGPSPRGTAGRPVGPGPREARREALGELRAALLSGDAARLAKATEAARTVIAA